MPVLVSSSELESSSLAKGFLKKLVASGCRPESLIQGFSSSGLGIAWARARSRCDELGLVNERIVSKRVVGGDRVALGIAIWRALKYSAVVCHELATGLVLKVVDENALEGRAQRNGDDHADGTISAEPITRAVRLMMGCTCTELCMTLGEMTLSVTF